MDLDEFIITIFCFIEEAMPTVIGTERLRQRGPTPRLHDSAVLTMEVAGAYLGFAQDIALCAYFHRHWRHFFPALQALQRTTFVRQAANLWVVKERRWQELLPQIPHDPHLALVDSCPLHRRGTLRQGRPDPPALRRFPGPYPPRLARRRHAHHPGARQGP